MALERFAPFFILILLAACNTAGNVDPEGDPYAPGFSKEEGVDGLLVGHRLMEAGEYELALKAYLRAGAKYGLNVDVLSALGSANLRLGRLGQSEKLLRQATEEDPTFVPAWNNLGVVLMETDQIGEASRVFKTAYALDSGESDSIRENLRLALAKIENPGYAEQNKNKFELVRRGSSSYLLLQTPNEN
ncbi:tetratricopeptide repeat protein [Halocynthiibacter sp. C4]|uniref:tetratricopeptide repeat protein n=1 Tax=Halocynthiibacter sp. C4 TaxID=2992758 RepID=UPI00237BD8B3|nr:tetratricopeptide repeat protein [Halocynthiibacter sp. C4]MDE0588701.1 tetratricopeptide repeat protein [Halocynthiibacter sp. C4]